MSRDPTPQDPTPQDPRVRTLGEHTFLRVTTTRPFDRLVWLVNVVGSLGAGTGSAVAALGCQSQLADQWTTEIIVSCPLSPAETAARAMGVHPLALDDAARAVVCPVHSFDWFAECVASTGVTDVVTYDPASGVCVDHLRTPRSPAWRAMNGWIARRVERTELVHPRAMDAYAESRKMEAALRTLLGES